MTTTQAAAIFAEGTGPNLGHLTAVQRVRAWRQVLARAANPQSRRPAYERVAYWQDVADIIAAEYLPRATA